MSPPTIKYWTYNQLLNQLSNQQAITQSSTNYQLLHQQSINQPTTNYSTNNQLLIQQPISQRLID